MIIKVLQRIETALWSIWFVYDVISLKSLESIYRKIPNSALLPRLLKKNEAEILQLL